MNPTPLVIRRLVSTLLAVGLFAGPTLAAELTARDVTQTIFKSGPGQSVDYSGRALGSLDLSGLDFKRAILANADLFGTDLSHANLSGVNLSGARLDRATIIGANFTDADLSGMTMRRPNVFSSFDSNPAEAPIFRGANLSHAQIVANHLDGADFSGADLTGAMLGPVDHAWGEERYAQRAIMIGCDFSGVHAHEVNLIHVVLQFAKFRNADLSGALLAGADLSKADLTGADLTGADLTGANLDETNLSGVKGLSTVRGLKTVFNFDRAVK